MCEINKCTSILRRKVVQKLANNNKIKHSYREIKQSPCAWVPTNLRCHHSDVVPGCVFPVQRLCGPDSAADFINPEVPFVILFTVQEISVGGGKPGHS